MTSQNKKLFSSFILGFCSPFVCGRPPPLACAVRLMAAFAVNVALAASQWQHRVRTISSHPTIYAEHEAGLTASTVFQVFGMSRPGIELGLPALVTRTRWARAQPTIPLRRLYKNMRSFCRKYSILTSDQLKFSSFSLARSRTRAQTLNCGWQTTPSQAVSGNLCWLKHFHFVDA